MDVCTFKSWSLISFVYLLLGLGLLGAYPRLGWGQSGTPRRYTVQPGETLSHIALKLYKDASRWREIYEANKEQIRNPKELGVGWKLVIPNRAARPAPEPTVTKTQPEATQAELEVATVEPLPPAVVPPLRSSSPQLGGADKRITLIAAGEHPPFTGEDLPQQGMLTEVVRTAFASMGYEVEFAFWEGQRGFKAAQEGRFAGTFPHFIHREHLTHFFYSKPLFRLLIRGFVDREQPFRFERLRDLSGRVVCRPAGHDLYDLQPLLVKQHITLKTPKTTGDCFDLLMQGKVDVVSVNEFAGQEEVHEAGLRDRVCMLDKEVAIDTVHLLFPKRIPQSEGLMKQFDQTLTRLEAKGALKDINARHLQHYYDQFGMPPAYCFGNPKSDSPLTQRR